MLQDFNEMIDGLLDTGENRRQVYENLIKLLNLQDQEAVVSRMHQGPSLLRTSHLSNRSVFEAASAPPAPLNFKVIPHISTGSNEPFKTSNHGDRSQVLQYDASKKVHTYGRNPSIIPKCRVDDVLQRIDEVRWQLNQLEAERKELEASDIFEQGIIRYGNVNVHCAVVKNLKKIDVLLRDCLQEHKKVAVALKSSQKLRQNLTMKTAFDEFQIAVLAVMELRESSLCKDKKSPGGEGMNGGMMILGQSIRKARTALWAVS